MNGGNSAVSVKWVVLCGMLAAVTAGLQVAMAPLPNIEPVSLLILVYIRVFGRRAFQIIVPFIALEGLVFGFGLWWVSYLYIWPLWALTILLLGKDRPLLTWAVVSGAFGLAFGALCALPYLAGGPWAALSYWLAGIPFDLLHCVGNFVLTLTLAEPLCRLLRQLWDRAR